MLTALERGEAARRARSSRSTRCPRPGCSRFKNPQTAARPARARHGARRPLPAGPGRRRPGAVPGARSARSIARATGRRSTATSSTRTATGFDELRASSRALDRGPTSMPRPASTARGDRAARASSSSRSERIDRVLGDGPHAAPQRGRDDPRDREPPAAARQHRPPGRRALPGARPLQRAGRPHDGHLRAARRRRSSTRSGASSASSRRARRATTPSTRIRAMRDGRASRSSSALGGNFARAPRRTRDGTEAALRALPADRARLDQAQPLARRAPATQALILPASGAPSATCRRPASSSSPSRTR